MKKLTLALACCFAMTLNSAFSQLSNEKKYDFLKNYKAPDFKQKRLDVALSLSGGNEPNYISSLDTRFSESTTLGYSQYSNQQDYQGYFNASYRSHLTSTKSDTIREFYTNNDFSMATQNRFYFKPKWFFGVYGDVYTRHYYREVTGQERRLDISLSFTPTVAIGNGRLEPIQYARNAMDIEKQLTKGNRLSSPYSIDQLNKIANQLAVINNVRFYDYRLRRIEQFEAIDKTIREIGGVSEFDMAYFAHLADAYLYAQNFPRFSGFRNELGITNFSELNYNIGTDKHMNLVNTALYYSATYNLPASYALQHTFTGTAIVGGSHSDISDSPNSFTEEAFVVGGYELGLYPTTRTNFNFGARFGVDISSENYSGDLYANGSVYLSPQFRLTFEANYSPEDGYFPHLYRSIPNFNGASQTYGLGGFIRLNYAIF